MRLICNENIAATVINSLRNRGHDVVSVKESMPGATDAAILVRARAESRLVITHDKDFGELAFHHSLPATCGIVLFRLAGPEPACDHERILTVLASRSDWSGHFTVVTDDRVRMRPLPCMP